MHIGINARLAARSKKTGVGNVAYQLALHLPKIDPKNTYHFYTDQPLSSELLSPKNVIEELLPPSFLWHKAKLPLALRRSKLDVFIEPGYYTPRCHGIKTITFIHDLAFKHFPKAYSAKGRFLQESAIKKTVSRSDRILFISKATQTDFEQFYSYPKAQTAVVDLGFDKSIFKPREQPNTPVGSNSPYILFVGRLEDRKNVARILHAFVAAKKKANLTHKLVLAGHPGHGYDQIRQEIEALGQYRKDVLTPGFLSDTELAHAYNRASLFLFPSLYEGFGIPILEAFASGTPVITSNISSMPEVAGNAAFLVDPLSEEEIADAIIQILSDSSLRDSLVHKGLARAHQFNWEKTAEQVLETIKSLG